ncbi:MAG: DUF421 domain-containing protein [Nitriliruptorales bacterium]|nr:DUF421 domain-containing protein [Nitriliruptorales bacterium]
MAEAIGASWSTLGWTVANAALIYLATIVYTRLAGLRSFAKMSSFDFAMTVSIGSIIATTVASSSVSAAQGTVGLAAIYVLQIVVAVWRTRTEAGDVVDNSPLLLMVGDRILDENLRRGRVTRQELRAKLREANVLTYSQIRAVVLESTGDVAVLHTTDDEVELDLDLLQDVRDVEELRRAAPLDPR